MQMREGVHGRAVDHEQVHQLPVVRHEWIESDWPVPTIDYLEGQIGSPRLSSDGGPRQQAAVHPRLVGLVHALPPSRATENGHRDYARGDHTDQPRTTPPPRIHITSRFD